jgi:flagellar FliL protein
MRLGRIILIVVLLLLIAGGMVAGLFFRDPIKQMIGLGAAAPDAGPPPKPAVKAEDVVYLDLPDMMVTLNAGGDHGNHTVKISASLELDDKSQQARVQAYIPRVVDVFQVYVRQLTVEQILGAPHLQHLREELLPRLNTALEPSHVDGILFREVLVQ